MLLISIGVDHDDSGCLIRIRESIVSGHCSSSGLSDTTGNFDVMGLLRPVFLRHVPNWVDMISSV